MSSVALVSNSPDSKSADTPASVSQEEGMVVRLSQLDKMLQLTGEVIIVSSNLNIFSRQWNTGETLSDTNLDSIRDLAVTSNRISSDLHRLVSEVRTVDMGHLFMRFRRLARDTSRRLGRPIHFELSGEDVTIDKKLSEKIYDPIAHQIRNAIAHGVEDEQTRSRLGKDPIGTVTVSVSDAENATVIEVSDDGAGIDTDALRKRLVDKGWIDHQKAASLSVQQAYDYLFMPGFSTATTTSETAGRGVGLDVVRNVVNQVDGEIRVESELGHGSTFIMTLPKVTAVNISDSLLVCANDTFFAFPITSVMASLSVSAAEVTTTIGRGRSIIYLGKILPLFDLLEVLGEQGVQSDDQWHVLIVEHKHRCAAYVVSKFLNPQKIVISNFEENLKVNGLLGTAILSGRQMAMVVDLPRLFDLTFGSELQAASMASPAAFIPGCDSSSDDILSLDQGTEPSEQSPLSPDAEGALDQTRPDADFLVEVESMLSDLNRQLLRLDENRDVESAHAVFRLAHSIKGNLTMYGAEEPASITHDLEDVLARIRRQALDMTDELFGVLFDGSAYLEDVVGLLLKDQSMPSPPERLVTGLASLRQTQQTSGATETDFDMAETVLDSMGQFYLSSRRRTGAALRQCIIEFDPADQPDFLVAYLILRRIQRVADVLGTLPAMKDIENGHCGKRLKILLASPEFTPQSLKDLKQKLKRYYGVKRMEVTSYA